MQIHQQENLKMAFDYMKTENVGLVNCSGKDVNEGNENIILGVMWSVISRFQLGEISMDGIR